MYQSRYAQKKVITNPPKTSPLATTLHHDLCQNWLTYEHAKPCPTLT